MSADPALVRDYDFTLPEELIAQEPPAERSGARMLTLSRQTGALHDARFADLPQLLQPGDLLVLNDSRVFPARLFGRRAGATGRVEVLLTEEVEPCLWRALVRPGRKLQVGAQLEFPQHGPARLQATVLEHGEFGERLLQFAPSRDGMDAKARQSFFEVLETIGQMPLPPYIRRAAGHADAQDAMRYQTVYANERGSAAAPTAGLHFTPQVLEAVSARGVELARVTLHVGLGTFQPVRVERVDAIHLHRERYTLSAATAAALNSARAEGRRIVAVGTTTVRTLEACALHAAGGPLEPHSGATDIFIAPGFRFQLVQAMLTNFHLPQSTLLMLVSAFAGYAPVMTAYRHAVASHYRFFSYGDCMFVS